MRRGAQGQVAVITGASSGIGAEVTRQLAQRGARVALLARSRDTLSAVASSLPAAPDDVVFRAVDVTDRSAVHQAVREIERELGPIDLLVNNAGIGFSASFLDTTEEDLRRVLEINLIGAVHVLQAVLPAMVERHRGMVVNVASVAGRIGAPRESAYSASKFALVGLTESVAAELHGSGVRFRLVDPGPVETQFFSRRGVPYERRSPRPVAASRVAREILNAAGGRAMERFVPRWLGGAYLVKTMLPPLYRAGTRWDERRQVGDSRPPGESVQRHRAQ